MELVSIQNRYGHGISFSQLAMVRVRESIRWALIGNYVDLQLNCDSLGALPTITQIMPAIYQHSSLRCPTSRRPIRRPMIIWSLVDFRSRSVTKTLFNRVPVDQPCKETEGQGTGGGTEIRAIGKYYPCNIIGDELLFTFGAKFQRQFVKLQNCHGNLSVPLSVKMATKF